jgi:flagellar hook assembly protein FlgD
MVRQLARLSALPGAAEFSWDGRNEAGTTVRTGMYYLRLTVGEAHVTHPMLLLH